MNFTIIGCGWLGFPLALDLINDGHSVSGSTTSPHKLSKLESNGIKSFMLQPDDLPQISTEITNNTDVLVLTIPPFDRNNINHYGNNLIQITSLFPTTTKIIFTSSTGIYPQKTGVFDEEYAFLEEEKNNVLFYAEERLKDLYSNRLTVFRLGGLIGPQRHPINYLLQKENCENPDAPINLVHLNDVIRAIKINSVQNSIYGTFNLVHSEHPSRKDYYTLIAEKRKLNAPKFSGETHINRSINGAKIEMLLPFCYSESLYF